MEWEYLFRNAILERGFEYYLMDKVTILEQSEDYFEAVVSGGEQYDVTIELEHGEVMEMSCTCPYASDGKNCKHMAATMYVVEDLLEDEEETGPAKTARMSVDQMVESASTEQIRSFLTEILSRDKELRLGFQDYIRSLTAAPDLISYRDRIDHIIWKYEEHNDWIDYDHAYDFMGEIVDVMKTAVNRAMKSGHLSEALEMTGRTFLEMADVEMDDSGGELTWFIEECTSLWEKIYCLAENDRSNEALEWMFRWFQKQLNEMEFDYFEDELRNFFLAHFDSEEFIGEKDRYINVMITKMEKAGELDGYYGYQMQDLLVSRLETMEKQNATWDTLCDYCRQYWQFSHVRRWYVEQCLEREEIDEAIRVLEESRELDCGMWGLLQGYEEQLWKLYRQRGERGKSENSLIRLLVDLQCDDLEYWQELKDMYDPKQWNSVRGDLIDRMHTEFQRCVFYREEGMTEQLAKEVLRSKNLTIIRQYKKDILPQYSEGVLCAYEEIVRTLAQYTSGRKTYRQIVTLLREIQTDPGGEEAVQKIVREFRIMYHNRPAMMDELRKLQVD